MWFAAAAWMWVHAAELHYTAPTECPAAAVMRSEIEARLDAPLSAEGRLPVVIAIGVRRDGDTWEGQATVSTPSHEESRTLRDDSDCGTLISALGWVVAREVEALAPVQRSAPATERPSSPDPTRAMGRLEALATASPGPLPGLVGGAQLGGGVRLRRAVFTAKLGPRLTAEQQVGGVSTRFVQGVAHISGRVRFGRDVGIEVGPGIEAGLTWVRVDRERAQRLWLAPDLTIELSSRDAGFGWVAGLSLAVPITQTDYRLRSGEVLHRTPAVTGSLYAGIRWGRPLRKR